MKPKTFLLTFVVLFIFPTLTTAFGKTGPTLIMDKRPMSSEFTGGIGPMLKYKRVDGPQGFGGDITLWGLRVFGGKLRDPELGIIFNAGTLSGPALKLNLNMAGLVFEDSFREDSRVKWRVSLGYGNFKLKTRVGEMVMNQGSFTFAEPMILGVLPLSRHIVLEFGAGYTFAGTTGVRIEGLVLTAEMLMGKF